MANGLEIIPSALLLSKVSIQRSISSRSSQVFTLFKGNVTTIGLSKELGKTKVNDEYSVLVLIVTTDEEVIRLDVSVNYSLRVNFLDSTNHLNSAVANSWQIKLLLAVFKETLEGLTQKIHDHNVELVGLTLFVSANIVQLRHEGCEVSEGAVLTLIS